MSQALCISSNILKDYTLNEKSLLHINYPVGRLASLQTQLLDRKDCETDPTQLQLIPYITLYDPNICCFFIYQRGQKGTEDRLHGRCSMGLGGHIEVQPHAFGDDLLTVIAKETARELEEETGLTEQDIPLKKILDNLLSDNFGMIYSHGSEVDRVHLGISMIFHVNYQDVRKTEDNVISKGEWLTLGEIYQKIADSEIEVENWTKIVLETISSHLNLNFEVNHAVERIQIAS